MDTLDVGLFEGTQLHRVEDFDASKCPIKELRMKDLHKNLCKRPYFHTRLTSRKRSTCEAERAEPSGEQQRSSSATSDAEYETCEEDGVASVQEDPALLSPSDDSRWEELLADKQPCNRTGKRKTRLPGKFRDIDDVVPDLCENYPIYYTRGVLLKSSSGHFLTREQRPSTQTEFFEVPIETHEVEPLHCDAAAATSGGHRVGWGSSKAADSYPCTPFERKSPRKPLKKISHSRSSSQKRHPPSTKHSRVCGDDSESMGTSTDTDPSEGQSNPSPTSSMKWKHKSPDVTSTKEDPYTGKRRTLESASNEKAGKSISGSKLKEKKGRSSESNWKRTCASHDGTTEGMQPMRCRPNSPDTSTSVEGILPVEKKRTLENNLKEKKSRAIDSSKSRQKMGRILEKNPTWNYNSQRAYSKKAFAFPTVLEGELNEKKSRTIENSIPKSRLPENKLKRGYNPRAHTEETHPKNWRQTVCNATGSGKGALQSKSKDEKIGKTTEGKRNQKNGRTPVKESKRRHSAPHNSLVLPMKWRLPKGKRPVESKWKETNGGTNEVGSIFKGNASGTHGSCSKVKEKASGAHETYSKVKKANVTHEIGSTFNATWTMERGYDPSRVIRDATGALRIAPVKRKYSYSDDASTQDEEQSPFPQRKKTPDSMFIEKKSKRSNGKPKELMITSTETELGRQMNNAWADEEDKPAKRRARIPIRKLKSAYTSEDGASDVEGDGYGGPRPNYPTFATEMKHSNVITCFWMGVPADFCNRHMPCHDQFMVLQDATGLKWEANYLARKKGLSGGWRRFSLDHHLEMGDVVMFELVRPQKFLVHITKVFGSENAGTTFHVPVRRTPKTGEKLKDQASTAKRRVAPKETALFSNRNRVNKGAERKVPANRKPHVASDLMQQRRVEAWTSPKRLYHSGGSFQEDRQFARMEANCHDDANVSSSSAEESESDDERVETQRGRATFPEFNDLTSSEDDRSDSNVNEDSEELGLTVREKSQRIESPSPKHGPPKKKLRRMS